MAGLTRVRVPTPADFDGLLSQHATAKGSLFILFTGEYSNGKSW
jgi:hypothetical protein